jgi:serine protease
MFSEGKVLMSLKLPYRTLGLATMAFILAIPVNASIATADPPQLPTGAALNIEPEEMVSNLIVKPHAEAGAQLSSALQTFDAGSLSKAALVSLTVVRSMSSGAHVIKLEQPVTLSEARIIAARLMHNNPSLEYAEPDRMVYPLTTTPTDPGYGNQWHYFAPNGTTNKGGANLPLAWDVAKGNPSVVVALIDNGYRPHIDFPQLLPGFDFIIDPTADRQW